MRHDRYGKPIYRAHSITRRELGEAQEEFSKRFPQIKRGSKVWIEANKISARIRSDHPDWTAKEIIDLAGRMALEQASHLQKGQVKAAKASMML